MRPAIAVHLGLDAVDPTIYGDWDGRLRSSEADADAMHTLAGAAGYTTRHLLLGRSATCANLSAILYAARDELNHERGRLLLTFAGHGGSYPSITRPGERDQAWCLRDELFLDKRMNAFFCTLAAAVRVLVVSDSCYSGTITDRPAVPVARAAPAYAVAAAVRAAQRGSTVPRPAPPEAPFDHTPADGAQRGDGGRAAAIPTPDCSVLLLAACPDDQGARESDRHGAFTEALIAAWNRGGFQGDHDAFLRAIASRMPPGQMPQLRATGTEDRDFRSARPFTALP